MGESRLKKADVNQSGTLRLSAKYAAAWQQELMSTGKSSRDDRGERSTSRPCQADFEGGNADHSSTPRRAMSPSSPGSAFDHRARTYSLHVVPSLAKLRHLTAEELKLDESCFQKHLLDTTNVVTASPRGLALGIAVGVHARTASL